MSVRKFLKERAEKSKFLSEMKDRFGSKKSSSSAQDSISEETELFHHKILNESDIVIKVNYKQ